MSEKLKKIRIDIISLLLTIICINFFGILGLGLSIIFLIAYYINVKKHYTIQKVLLTICFIGVIIAFTGILLSNGMENKGIDAIGEAIVYAFFINIGRIVNIICPIILLIIDNIIKK